MSSAYRPVVIIGAPRSGTNMLRDILCDLPGMATWPCDEINYLWRYGNVDHPTDELLPEMLTPKIRQKIVRSFDWVASKYEADFVVEKTCANSLRVPFVEAVLDQPEYVYIVRDGVDAAVSATERWRAPLDIPYLAKKVRFVPAQDLPRYAARYASARVARLRHQERALSTWGPKFEGLDTWAREESTLMVSARQWQACVDASDRAFEDIPQERVHRVSYEGLVSDPSAVVANLAKELGWVGPQGLIDQAVSGVSSNSVGKGRGSLAASQLADVQATIKTTLERHGYPIS